jgi:two-component system response regulator FlrC
MRPADHIGAGAVKILVVDDDHLIRWVIARRFQGSGAVVIEAASAEEAIEIVACQAFDLIVSDIVLPGADGMAVLAAARAAQPRAKVFLMTAHPEVLSCEEARKLGAADLIIKRTDMSWVAEIVSAAATCRVRHQNSVSGQA